MVRIREGPALPDRRSYVGGGGGASVANPNLPRRLKFLLEATGFGALRAEAIPILNFGSKENSFSAGMLDNFARAARKRGTISETESSDWLDGIDRLAGRGEYFFCVNRFLFSAVK